MLWADLKMGALAGLAMAMMTLAAGATMARQEKDTPRAAPAREAPKGAARPAAPAVVLFGPLPPRDELHRLLRQTASEGIVLSRLKPVSQRWFLSTIAASQAKAGDADGARTTFAAAVQEAAGEFGGDANPWDIWRVGEFQREADLKEDALATLRRAVEAIPVAVGDSRKDHDAIRALAAVVEEQARMGARDEARRTADLLLEFVEKCDRSRPDGRFREGVASELASAFAAAGDLDAAFQEVRGQKHDDRLLGQIAMRAARSLDRESARKFIREADDRLAMIKWADEKDAGLNSLSDAQALVGDIEAARRTAATIGEGPSRSGEDRTEGQSYAFMYIAMIQLRDGDRSGARESLSAAFRSVKDHPRMRYRDDKFLEVAEAQAADGDLQGAGLSIAAAGVKRPLPLAYLARAQAAAGDQAAAQETYARALTAARESIEEAARPDHRIGPNVDIKTRRTWTRKCLAEVQAMAGNVGGALETVRSLEDLSDQRFALRAVVNARATAGDVAGALRLALAESQTPEERHAALKGLAEGVDTRFSHESLRPRGD